MPVRGTSLLLALSTVIRTVPLPVPLAPLVIVIHEADVVAVQSQAAPAVTWMLKLPPWRSKLCDVALRENVHVVPCVTVNVLPAIVRVPVRTRPGLEAAENVTVPLPLPLAPEPIVSHVALLAAVHVQPAAAVTEMGEPLPPAAPIDCPVGAIEGAQPLA